jgi:cobalt-precorrin 5A hydrolase
MARSKAMTAHAKIGAGFGCRSGCDVGDLLSALRGALAQADRDLCDVATLFAPEFKRDERGLWLAADQLGKPLRFLPIAQLQAHASGALTHSGAVQQRYGLPSVAETAALAGASELATPTAAISGAHLLAPRNVSGAATCALAEATTLNLTQDTTP